MDNDSNLIWSAIMGILGGFITTPINAIFAWMLKRDEQDYQHRLDLMLKRYELLLKHKLELENEKGHRKPKSTEE